jgi:hypothetical protein
VDASSHSHGVNYQAIWTAEAAGWCEHFLRFIAELEGARFCDSGARIGRRITSRLAGEGGWWLSPSEAPADE